uniref:BTB domain-containing protein n=1 Tax=Syphacia muris TaxID=451379 RepID=A0A158R4M7_9BILA
MSSQMITVPKTLKKTEYDSLLRTKLEEQRKNEELIDCIIHAKSSDTATKTFKVHRIILAAGSQYFKALFEDKKMEAISEIDLNICAENAICCFGSLLNFLYTGCLHMSECTPLQMIKIAKLYEVGDVIEMLLPYIQELPSINSNFLPVLFSSFLIPSQTATLELLLKTSEQKNNMNYLNDKLMDFQSEMARLSQPFLESQIYNNSSMPQNLLPSTKQPDSELLQRHTKRRRRAESQDNEINEKTMNLSACDETQANSADSFSPMSDIIVPSNDREGWCRNKKYIEQVENGFMCTVCKKIYGRYNSVSYHVTIYHRNPPIKCDIEGCDFSTREARYIHFHKYYRHHIDLPNTIDLGCRKCSYCTHVSKSPAMLQKHIAKHLSEVGKATVHYAENDGETLENTEAQEVFKEKQQFEKNVASYPCHCCNYRGQSETLLKQHLLFKHSQDTFERKLSCKLCQYVCAESKMHIHYKDRHPDYKQQVHKFTAFTLSNMLPY